MTFSYLQAPDKSQKLPENPEHEQTKQPLTADTASESTSSDETKATGTESVTTSREEKTTNTSGPGIPEEDTVVETVSAGETVPFRVSGLTGHFNLKGASLASIKTLEYSRIDDSNKLYDLVFRRGDGLKTALQYESPILRNQSFKQVETSDSSVFHFRIRLENDLVFHKRYNFNQNKDYHAELQLKLTNGSSESVAVDGLSFREGPEALGPALVWGPGFGEGREKKTQFDKVYWYYGKNNDMQYLAPQGAGGFYSMLPFTGNGNEDKPYQYVQGPVDWSAVSNRYFVAAIVPDQSFEGLYLEKGDESDSFVTWSAHESINLDPNESTTLSYDLYLGPKFYSVLQSFHSGLESTLNYGWFTFITYPLLISLRWTYAVIPNYGIAIILLSIAIKFLLYPLTKKGLVSMQKMKKLQPKMKEIQDKYSDDKEKMNEKLMEFYSEHNVNPLGGCLPMLLQLPIFIALYRMLEYSIELRGAPFAFWVTDLSAKDPYYILPVIMGVLMFFQQWYTMSSGAGATGQQQQMMMYVMPVVFVFIFMNFPVGLVLYWMTNSAVTLLQYWMINRSMDLAET